MSQSEAGAEAPRERGRGRGRGGAGPGAAAGAGAGAGVRADQAGDPDPAPAPAPVPVPVPVPGRLLIPVQSHCPRDPLGLCSRPRRAPKLGQIGRSRKVDIEDSALDQFLGRGFEKPTSHL